MKRSDTLIFIPTYDERENAGRMVERLTALMPHADLLFVDDQSPDGTGELLDELAERHANLTVMHRAGKLGIGSAHIDGIEWAYEQGYRHLITMDCDFTHDPADIPRLMKQSVDHDVVVASRFMRENSLPGWSLLRRGLTNFGHMLTRVLLRMPFDATGAFRVYDLERIPRYFFSGIRSKGYSFFFESLFLLTRNGFSICEVPIALPARTYGHSKMSLRDAVQSGLRVWRLWIATLIDPNQFRVCEPFTEIDPQLHDPQGWDAYWKTKQRATNAVYEFIATIYRNAIIKPRLNRFIRANFPPGSKLLHAGCGSGHVDADLQHEMKLTAVDISVPALEIYQRTNPEACEIRHASILDLPFENESFDGAYNLGVVEHFEPQEALAILSELRRVVKPGGKVVIFWPHSKAPSVAVLGFAHWVLNDVLKKGVQLHPPEVSLVRSRTETQKLFRRAGWKPTGYHFGPGDLFIQAVFVAKRTIADREDEGSVAADYRDEQSASRAAS